MLQFVHSVCQYNVTVTQCNNFVQTVTNLLILCVFQIKLVTVTSWQFYSDRQRAHFQFMLMQTRSFEILQLIHGDTTVESVTLLVRIIETLCSTVNDVADVLLVEWSRTV